MIRMVKNPVHLSIRDIEEFSHALRVNNYRIVTSIPSVDNEPESLIPGYKDKETHQRILDDKNASLSFFSIIYINSSQEEVMFPMGVYGISDHWKVRFPLVVNGFWQGFFMGNKDFFRGIANIDEKSCEIYYPRMISLKRELMFKVFQYYYSLNADYCSAMAWEIRNDKSNTRTIAESIGFGRFENSGTEIYSSSGVTSISHREYLADCRLRWGIIIDDSLQNISNEKYSSDKLQAFIRGIVEYPL